MNSNDPHEAAIGWTIRLRDGSAEDWRAFTAWLEADPAHVAAYDEVSRADATLGQLPSRRQPVIADQPPPQAPVRSRRGWLVGGGLAAAAAGVLAVTTLQGPASYEVETRPGEHRSVQLADGSRIDLNGGSRLVLDRGNPRKAELARGEALFIVIHDDRRPFEVRVGDDVLKDLGTVFAVLHESGATEVAVSEGLVLYNPGGEAVQIAPGQKLTDDGSERVVLAQVDVQAVGSWRGGRLSYSEAPLTRVAADLRRNLGVPVRVDPSLSGRRFTGLVQLDAQQELLFQRLSALLGVRAVRTGDGWTLTAGDPS